MSEFLDNSPQFFDDLTAKLFLENAHPQVGAPHNFEAMGSLYRNDFAVLRRLRFTSTSFTAYIKRTTKYLGKNIV